MLERIHHIKGIGLLHEADGRAYGLKKATFLYADNGLGKSTLASIFRSCAIDNPDLILNRSTIGGTNEPEVNLQFSNGQRSNFQNGNWDQNCPELLVFDADFVDQNVYAGGKVTADQRKNLLQFALGASAVTAQHEYDQADENAKEISGTKREIVSKLNGFHEGLTLSEFQEVEEISDAEDKIATLNEKIVEAQNIGAIQSKALPKKLDKPNLDIEPFFQIISKSLADIDLDAEEKVKNHINSHDKTNLEKWISDGFDFGEEETCLFCNQSLEGVDLIEAYRSYFNKEYNELKNSVGRLNDIKSDICSISIINDLKASFSIASAVIDGWQEHITLEPPEFDEQMAKSAIHEIQSILGELKEAKEANLLDPVDYDEEKSRILENWEIIQGTIDECNESISNANQQIKDYKENLASVDIGDLKQKVKNIELAKKRHSQEVKDLFQELEEVIAQEATAKTEKEGKKDTLNQIMQSTLERYKDRINQLLRSFGAQFTIPNIDFNYRGSLSSDYVLQMRGSDISLSSGVPNFRTSLSESDKRTLAFAFFIASVEEDPNLSNKIILIDDPMCSLDMNRKQQTRTVLMRLHDNCEQLIILAHDIHFLRNLRDDTLRKSQPSDIKTLKLKSVSHRYSDFDDIDLDKESESSYFKCHRILSEYMAGNASSSMEVARSIRPMLEGYLHRRFPGLINKGLLFGQVINSITNAQSPSPLVHAQNITDELNEINQYAGQFHHDTNPSADQVQIVDAELLNFVERAINVVHTGTS